MTAPLLLAIESATSCVGCAVGTADGVLASARSVRSRRHAESLAPQIGFVTAQAGVALHDVDLIAVDVGPGLYTGLRVGVTTARAMAHTLEIATVAVSSLEAIAHVAGVGDGLVVAIDARRGEIFHSHFHVDGVGEPVATPPVVATAGEVDGLSGTRVVGDGALAYHEELAAAGMRVDRRATPYPTPEAVLAVAATRADRAVPPRELVPLYLRRPDAVARWESAS